ncbi:MAG: dicarboxylate/amino acid:cation symporter [Deltaproteobacteria bacterium]|nr:dicarboxylate/amino acid:cation symporter [Deltaproteobacteria bacterium]
MIIDAFLKKHLLPVLLMAGAVGGVVAGGVTSGFWNGQHPAFTGSVHLVGELFMNLLKIMVIPFIVTSMILGVTSMGGQSALKRSFLTTLIFYFFTTVLAVITGLLLVTLISPGEVGNLSQSGTVASSHPLKWYDALFSTIRSTVPSNIVMAAAKGEIIGVITFSILTGFGILHIGKKGKVLVEFTQSLNDVFTKLINWIIWIAPLGIFAIVFENTGLAGGFNGITSQLKGLGFYMLTVIAGLSVHAFLTLPLLLFLLTGRNPVSYALNFSQAIIMAFSTASSAATLPLTVKNSIENAKNSESISQLVLPLGATVNMDGTALYEAVAVVFVAQSFGMHLSFVAIGIIALTSTLAAVGAAAIPHAGLVTMVMVFSAADIPPEIASKGIAAILAVDWILDRFRTSVNVWGDAVGTAVVDRLGSRKTK